MASMGKRKALDTIIIFRELHHRYKTVFMEYFASLHQDIQLRHEYPSQKTISSLVRYRGQKLEPHRKHIATQNQGERLRGKEKASTPVICQYRVPRKVSKIPNCVHRKIANLGLKDFEREKLTSWLEKGVHNYIKGRKK